MTMIMVSVALVMTVIVTNIHLRKDSTDFLPMWLQLLIRSPEAKHHRIVDTSSHVDQTGVALMALPGAEVDNVSLFSDSENRIWKKRKSHHLNCEISRNHVTTTTSSLRAGAETANGVIVNHHHSASSCHYHSPESEQYCNTQYNEEWHRLACIIDRIFFWLFFITSILILSIMYFTIPTYI